MLMGDSLESLGVDGIWSLRVGGNWHLRWKKYLYDREFRNTQVRSVHLSQSDKMLQGILWVVPEPYIA